MTKQELKERFINHFKNSYGWYSFEYITEEIYDDETKDYIEVETNFFDYTIGLNYIVCSGISQYTIHIKDTLKECMESEIYSLTEAIRIEKECNDDYEDIVESFEQLKTFFEEIIKEMK